MTGAAAVALLAAIVWAAAKPGSLAKAAAPIVLAGSALVLCVAVDPASPVGWGFGAVFAVAILGVRGKRPTRARR